ncbi:hypothetical protein GCM10009557_01570 [Virgisporangium ochraceum]
MVAGERIEWRRAFPRRAVRMLTGCTVAAALVAALGWAMFGTEPATLNTGAANPLAVVPQWTLALVAAAVAAAAVPVLRRPLVAASHVTLHVRPGVFRTLALPWTTVAAITGVDTPAGEFLLVRLTPHAADRPGPQDPDRPGFWDRTVLRAATRAYPPAAGYDLAVRLGDYTGTSAAKEAGLAAYSPESVEITSRL